MKGKFEDSRKEFEAAIKIAPHNAEYYYRLGNLYQVMNRNEDALRQYSTALALNPNFTEVYYCIGIMNSSQGNQSKAIDYFSRVLAIDPQDFSSINAIGVAHMRAARYNEAIASFRNALMVKPGEAGILRNIALVYILAGFDVKVVKEHQKAYGLEPYTSQIMAFMGTKFTQDRDYENAINILRSALTEDPFNIKARASLATVCFFKGYYNEAGRESSEILRIQPYNKVAREIVGRLTKMGL